MFRPFRACCRPHHQTQGVALCLEFVDYLALRIAHMKPPPSLALSPFDSGGEPPEKLPSSMRRGGALAPGWLIIG